MILGLHEMDVSFIKSSLMSVCWPETPQGIAIMQSCVMDRLHFCELVKWFEPNQVALDVMLI